MEHGWCSLLPCHSLHLFLNKDAEAYVDEWFMLETYFMAYSGSIPPCEGERYWPKVPCNLDPPPIKIGPGRPRKNRIKHPLENPKKPGSLLRSGIEMTCSICKSKGHNKKSCPDKGTYVEPEPAPKRPIGRPRNDFASTQPLVPSQVASSSTHAATTTTAPVSAQQATSQHHTTTAQPTQLGRGGRVILGGQGERGVTQAAARKGVFLSQPTASGQGTQRTRGRGTGRGIGRGRTKVPIGVGVLFSSDGTPLSQGANTRGGGRRKGRGLGRGSQSTQ